MSKRKMIRNATIHLVMVARAFGKTVPPLLSFLL